MAQYYYAVTSLPLLSFDSENYPSLENLNDLCFDHLSTADQKIMDSCFAAIMQESDRDDGRVTPLADRWQSWNRSLLADLAVLRAQELGKDLEEYQALPRILGTEEKAREIFSQETPLAAEEALERIRWSVLDELEVGHYFDVQKLYVYALRVAILERKARFSKEMGTENFTRIYSAITE